MKTLLTVAGLLILLAPIQANADQVSDFQDVTLGTGGTYTSPDFISGNVQYGGLTNPFSDGFVVSNHTDVTDYGDHAFQHQYDAIPGHGSAGSTQYAVASDFFGADALLPSNPISIDITNNTYAYYSMQHGDSFAKQFGGESGNDPDWFLLTITGYNASNNSVGSVPFYLADYRFANNAQDYIVSQWTTVDLSSLVGARELDFSLSSSDNDPTFGMNTPAFFAADNLRFASSVLRGDMNNDTFVDNTDIEAFVGGLVDPVAWHADHPDGMSFDEFMYRGDINNDTYFDNVDIAGFVDLLVHGSPAAAVPEPASLALAAIGLLLFASRRAWRRCRAKGR